MQPQGQSTGGPGQKAQTALALLLFTARSLSVPLEVLLRRDFGSRYFGFQALGGLVAIVLWMTQWPGFDLRPLTGFWWLVVLMLVRARIESARRARAGAATHTRYNGWPRLAKLFPRMSETRIKGVIEPALAILVGILASWLSEPLGSFLLLSALALWIAQATNEAAEHARVVELNDAYLEQQSLAEHFRTMQRRH